MEIIQIQSNDPNVLESGVKNVPQKVLTDQQQKWIDYSAVGGMITENDGTIQRMTVIEFSEREQIPRQTLYSWRKSIPNFWEQVAERRRELGSQTRLQKVYDGLYLKASTGMPEAVKLYLQIFDNWQPPAQSIQHNLGDGYSDAMMAMKKRQEAIEGEVVDARPIPEPAGPGTSHSDGQGPIPADGPQPVQPAGS